MKNLSKSFSATSVATSALVLAAASAVYGAEPVASSADATVDNPVKTGSDKFFTEDLVGAFKNGKFNLNARMRYEYADQDGLDASNAFTLSTRFGFTTAPLYGFQAMMEGENISAIGNRNNYNDAAGNGAGKTAVADAATTQLNQYWLSYSRWDTTLKGPRQRINLDNQRFVGAVGWRQNDQTFDAVALENHSIENTSLYLAYLYQINRVFGAGNPGGTWQSRSYLFNANWDGCQYARVTPYVYLLDFENDSPANSTASYGASVTGKAPIAESAELSYRGEVAWQTDYADNPADYGALYYHANVDGKFQKRWSLGAGYEVLGSDNNQGFKTPLATLHSFNGWADAFLTTPGQGLRDLYGSAGVNLPGDFPLKFVYHKFDSDKMSINYGQEFDVVLSKKFYERFTALAKYAYFDGKGAAYPDRQKFWAQLSFNY